jgi:hypothetical protein
MTVIVSFLVKYKPQFENFLSIADIDETQESKFFKVTIGVGVGVGVGIILIGVGVGSTFERSTGVLPEDCYRGHPASDAILSECSILTIPFSPQATTDHSFLIGAVKRSSSRFKDLAFPASKV